MNGFLVFLANRLYDLSLLCDTVSMRLHDWAIRLWLKGAK